MDIYIAAKVVARFRLRGTRTAIQELGHRVVSTWINTATDYGSGDATPDRLRWAGEVDLSEIDSGAMGNNFLFIIDSLDESTTGGRETELGYYLALRRRQRVHPSPSHEIWRVGPVRNLYHVFADRVFETWEELLAALPKNI